MRHALTVVLLLSAASASAEVRREAFASPSLGREVAYLVDLPASYTSGTARYPVLYVLHGLFEGPGFWERRGLAPILSQLRERGEIPEWIVVVVDGGNSFYVNGPLGRYEDLITRDLPAHVDATYRTVPGRSGRALLGVSMGGYAALRLAFKHPELFAAVAAHSAMLLRRVPTPGEGAGRWHMAAFRRAFGDPIDTTLWAASDPFAWAEKAEAGAAPALHFDCGSEDRYGLSEGNRELHQLLEGRRIAHSFGLPPGDHGYDYVRSVLATSLTFLGRRVGSQAPADKAGARDGGRP